MNIEPYLDQIFLKDVFDVLKELPDKSVDMVYGDPDYNVGVKYGDRSYTRTFDEYIDWYISLAKESLRVLKDSGNLFLINYPKQNSYLRVKYLDSACYEVSDYAWVYNTNVGHTPKRFTTAHRSILHCRKTEDSKFYKDNVAVPYQNPTDRRILRNLANGSKGRMPYDWLYFNLVKNVSKEKTFHACQIPQQLSELLIKSCTMPEDTVLVLFGGSGSEIEVCKVLNRHFISVEVDEKYHRMIVDRLNKGKIEEKYKLVLHRYERNNLQAQLALLEEKEEYVT
jgi:DNA modification methylase